MALVGGISGEEPAACPPDILAENGGHSPQLGPRKVPLRLVRAGVGVGGGGHLFSTSLDNRFS